MSTTRIQIEVAGNLKVAEKFRLYLGDGHTGNLREVSKVRAGRIYYKRFGASDPTDYSMTTDELVVKEVAK